MEASTEEIQITRAAYSKKRLKSSPNNLK